MEKAGKRLSIRGWIHFVVNHPTYIIAAILTVTLFFGLQIPKLRFQTSIYDLAIQDLPETIRYQAFKETFGSDELILVVVKTDDVFAPRVFEALTDLAGRLSAVEGIKAGDQPPGDQEGDGHHGKVARLRFQVRGRTRDAFSEESTL